MMLCLFNSSGHICRDLYSRAYLRGGGGSGGSNPPPEIFHIFKVKEKT